MADISNYWVPQKSDGYYYAGFPERFLANIADLILFEVNGLVILKIIDIFIPLELDLSQNPSIEILFGILFFFYYILFTAIWGKTPGKKLLGLTVLKKDFTKISIPRALLRESIGRIIANMVMLSYLAVGFSGHKRGLHDLVGGTIVVRNSPGKRWERILFGLIVGILFVLPFIGFFLVLFLGATDPLGQLNKLNLHSKDINIKSFETPSPIPTITQIPIKKHILSIPDVSRWERYQSPDKGGISFSYPPGSLVKKGDSEATLLIFSYKFQYPWSVRVEKGIMMDNNLDFKEYVQAQLRAMNSPDKNSQISVIKETEINGHKVIIVSDNNAEVVFFDLYAYVQKDTNSIVRFVAQPDIYEDTESFKNFFIQLVSTFSFDK